MNRIQALVNAENFILYQLPAGKPDPSEPCTPETLVSDNRKRTIQNKQKQGTCIYYAQNMIRNRIGKHPSPELEEARRIEKLCSERRKLQTKYETKWASILSDSSPKGVAMGKLDHSSAAHFVSQLGAKLEEINHPWLPVIKDFLKQTDYKTFYKYIKHLLFEKIKRVNELFIESFGFSAPILYEEVTKKMGGNWESLDEASEEGRQGIMCSLALKVSSKAYGLLESLWEPTQPIESLISELKKAGPLMIGGVFGLPAFTEEPFKMKKQIAGRDIFAWRPGTRDQNDRFGHVILLVGAQKNERQEVVYYVDPNDQSRPGFPSDQRIFAISIKSLKENIQALDILMLNRKFICPPNATYALASNRPPIHDQVYTQTT